MPDFGDDNQRDERSRNGAFHTGGSDVFKPANLRLKKGDSGADEIAGRNRGGGFVTIVQLLIQAYVPSIYEALGIYIPLIVVNCIILGRAESYALFNGPLLSFCDGLGMGLGFTFALVIIGSVRELIGSGSIFNFQIIPEAYHISIFVLAPGAFLVLAMLTAIQNKLRLPSATNGDAVQSEFVCSGNCMGCFSDCKTEAAKPIAKTAAAASAAVKPEVAKAELKVDHKE